MDAYERSLQQDADSSYMHRERSPSHYCWNSQTWERSLENGLLARGEHCPLRTLGVAFQAGGVAGRGCAADVILQQPCWTRGVFGRSTPNVGIGYDDVSGVR